MNVSGSKVMTWNARHTFGFCGNSYINHRGNLGVKKWPFLKRKFKLVSGKSSDLHKNWYKWSLGWYLNICLWDFWNFYFSRFYAYRKGQKLPFLATVQPRHAIKFSFFIKITCNFPSTTLMYNFLIFWFFLPIFSPLKYKNSHFLIFLPFFAGLHS